ncbi:hypothetical protein HerbRD11066_69710 [Herbidospora sp. RD11066]
MTTRFVLRPGDEIEVGQNRIVFMVSGGRWSGYRPDQAPTSADFGRRGPHVGWWGPHAASRPTGRDFSRRRGRATVEGYVRGVRQRHENYGENGGLIVLTFRLERFDRAGNCFPPVPIQLRATAFDGSFDEGDEVRVTGRWKRGTLHARRVHNITTGAAVGPASVTGCLLFLLASVIVVAAILVVIG